MKDIYVRSKELDTKISSKDIKNWKHFRRSSTITKDGKKYYKRQYCFCLFNDLWEGFARVRPPKVATLTQALNIYVPL